MDSVDEQAASNLQVVHERLQTGPWNTGMLGEKGATVSEPLDVSNPSNQDNIQRYTDRYLRHHQIGRTTSDFPFNPSFLSPDLHKIVKLADSSKQSTAKPKSRGDDKLAQRIAGIVNDEDEEHEVDEDEEEQDNEEEVEDEFEELDDDDYNAEKYFDDGDDYGDGDDGDNEAAY